MGPIFQAFISTIFCLKDSPKIKSTFLVPVATGWTQV